MSDVIAETVMNLCAIYGDKMKMDALTEYEMLLYEQCCVTLTAYLKDYEIQIKEISDDE